TGLEHNLAHQDKQGHGDETEFGDGEDELHRHAGEANLAAEKKENADDVDGEKGEGNPGAGEHQQNHPADQKQQGAVPFHDHDETSSVASEPPRQIRSRNSTAQRRKEATKITSRCHSMTTRTCRCAEPNSYASMRLRRP